MAALNSLQEKLPSSFSVPGSKAAGLAIIEYKCNLVKP